jgi:RimJ/RimL family protein N-acetyltransferase
LTYSRLYDMNLIAETITHPRIYPHVSDDLSPGRDSFVPCDHTALYYLGVWDELEFLGLWMFAPQNSICWEVHTCLLPHAWGAVAIEATIGAANYIFENTECRRIITTVPRTNLLALRLAKKAGLTQYGVNERSFLKNGELVDQILLGISKPEGITCQ